MSSLISADSSLINEYIRKLTWTKIFNAYTTPRGALEELVWHRRACPGKVQEDPGSLGKAQEAPGA